MHWSSRLLISCASCGCATPRCAHIHTSGPIPQLSPQSKDSDLASDLKAALTESDEDRTVQEIKGMAVSQADSAS